MSNRIDSSITKAAEAVRFFNEHKSIDPLASPEMLLAKPLTKFQHSHCIKCGEKLEPGVAKDTGTGIYFDGTATCANCNSERNMRLSRELREGGDE